MNEEQTYQYPAESDKVTEAPYGKFRNAEELLKAYNALESEFTRRSQKLKEYEKANGKEDAEAQSTADLARKYGVSEETLEEARKAVTETEKLETALIRVLATKNASKVPAASDQRVIDEVLSKESNREAVLNAYIASLKGTDVPPTLPKGGAIPTLRPFHPKTVREAGEIAKAILENL